MFDIAIPTVPVAGSKDRFPVRRIFCVGKNYADHVREMGGDPKEGAPIFFTKPADAVFVPNERGALRYPSATTDLHYEAELVVALGRGGEAVPEGDAASLIYGIAAGCDLTRRDAQLAAKAAGEPWDVAKGLDDGAVIGTITPGLIPPRGRIALSVNGQTRQASDLSAMIWSVPAIIAKLSDAFALKPGDLIYTGTPEGVGPLVPGDRVAIDVEGCSPVRFEVAPR